MCLHSSTPPGRGYLPFGQYISKLWMERTHMYGTEYRLELDVNTIFITDRLQGTARSTDDILRAKRL